MIPLWDIRPSLSVAPEDVKEQQCKRAKTSICSKREIRVRPSWSPKSPIATACSDHPLSSTSATVRTTYPGLRQSLLLGRQLKRSCGYIYIYMSFVTMFQHRRIAPSGPNGVVAVATKTYHPSNLLIGVKQTDQLIQSPQASGLVAKPNGETATGQSDSR